MSSNGRAVANAVELMMSFAERTGLASRRSAERYLWTDAFAVCNFLALARATRDERYTGLALALVDQVHHVLGRHRGDDGRTGWISGLSEAEGEAHPTQGGLRIGKKNPERSSEERFDELLEWDRDGQYFHYSTKWMHALDQVSRSTGEQHFNGWARELAKAAHAAFVRDAAGGGSRQMVWKKSIDLSRSLVSSMGQHDPLDGFVTCAELDATRSLFSTGQSDPSLRAAAADFAKMIDPRQLATPDPLGIGGLLMDACRLDQLSSVGATVLDGLLQRLLSAARAGLSWYVDQGDLREPASRRLAFRELGLSIGLSGIELIGGAGALRPYVPLASSISSFWLDRDHRQSRAWNDHRDINEVMLATALVPDGFLVLRPLSP